jgi:hypothetical protein
MRQFKKPTISPVFYIICAIFREKTGELDYIENIVSLIESWCKKKLVFASQLLPFGTVGEAHAHCAHLQITLANPQTIIYKRVQLLPSLKTLLI